MAFLTLNEAREAIYARWASEWGSTTPYQLDNEEFTPPADAPWARVVVRHRASGQETLGAVGSRRYQRGGSIFVQLFDLEGMGVQRLDGLAQPARAVFEGVSFSGIRVHDAVVREAGPDGRWYMVVIESFFDYEELK